MTLASEVSPGGIFHQHIAGPELTLYSVLRGIHGNTEVVVYTSQRSLLRHWRLAVVFAHFVLRSRQAQT
jgi:hypothetical protein